MEPGEPTFFRVRAPFEGGLVGVLAEQPEGVRARASFAGGVLAVVGRVARVEFFGRRKLVLARKLPGNERVVQQGPQALVFLQKVVILVVHRGQLVEDLLVVAHDLRVRRSEVRQLGLRGLGGLDQLVLGLNMCADFLVQLLQSSLDGVLLVLLQRQLRAVDIVPC